MDFLQKIKCNPKFPLIMAIISSSLLTITSGFSLYYYFTEIASNDFFHWQLIAYCIIFANGLTSLTEFFDEEQTFIPLRDLLDHWQVCLILPCYAAQMWIKTEMGPSEIALIHAALGMLAVALFIVVECKRHDLADLAIFSNAVSLIFMSAKSANLIMFIATILLTAGYYLYKRQEEVCCMAPIDKFNFIMSAFALLSLVSFNDDVTQSIQDFVNNIISSK